MRWEQEKLLVIDTNTQAFSEALRPSESGPFTVIVPAAAVVMAVSAIPMEEDQIRCASFLALLSHSLSPDPSLAPCPILSPRRCT